MKRNAEDRRLAKLVRVTITDWLYFETEVSEGSGAGFYVPTEAAYADVYLAKDLLARVCLEVEFHDEELARLILTTNGERNEAVVGEAGSGEFLTTVSLAVPGSSELMTAHGVTDFESLERLICDAIWAHRETADTRYVPTLGEGHPLVRSTEPDSLNVAFARACVAELRSDALVPDLGIRALDEPNDLGDVAIRRYNDSVEYFLVFDAGGSNECFVQLVAKNVMPLGEATRERALEVCNALNRRSAHVRHYLNASHVNLSAVATVRVGGPYRSGLTFLWREVNAALERVRACFRT